VQQELLITSAVLAEQATSPEQLGLLGIHRYSQPMAAVMPLAAKVVGRVAVLAVTHQLSLVTMVLTAVAVLAVQARMWPAQLLMQAVLAVTAMCGLSILREVI
jgi:hypothetical protein